MLKGTGLRPWMRCVHKLLFQLACFVVDFVSGGFPGLLGPVCRILGGGPYFRGLPRT